MTDPDAGDEARALKREHKHTQESIEGGEAVAPRDYAKRLAGFLAETDYFVSVVGHTDSQQPSRALAKRYPTNW